MRAYGGASCIENRIDRCGETAIMAVTKKYCPFVYTAVIYMIVLPGNKWENPHINILYYGAI